MTGPRSITLKTANNTKTMKSLDELLNNAAENLPEGWQIKIEVEKDSGSITAIRPNGSEVDMYDPDEEMEDQFWAALILAGFESSYTFSLENAKA